jgi:hypothetical protein
MKRGRLRLIVVSVLAVHAAFFWVVADKKVLPHKPYVAPANFSGREKVLTDDKSGETVRCREFTVSTKLASPAPTGNQTP